MRIGIPREIKNNENRVGATPAGVAALVGDGHEVVVETDAGSGSGFQNEEYREAGASVAGVDEVWRSDLVVKVKEPIEPEYPRLGKQVVFTYFHLAAADPALTETLVHGGTTAIAYETVEDDGGGLPLLAPMSAVAGSMAPLMGSYHLARFNQGRGVLLSDILGRSYGKVMVIGDGVVGRHAARVARATGTPVLIFGRRPERAVQIDRFAPGVQYVESTPETIATHVTDTDLLVGATLVRGARAAHLVTEAMVRTMPAGSVIVDVSIDQGGCVETSRPTSHADPVFTMHGVIHYCVTNMPGAYPRTSTFALTTATLPYVQRLAAGGVAAVAAEAGFLKGVNVHGGFIRCRPVAEALGRVDLFRAMAPDGA